MAPGKEGGRTRRKGSTGRSDSGRVEPTVEKEAGQVGGITMVDVDPWGSFFESFWEKAAEGESVDRHDGGRKSAKRTRTTGTKPGRKRSSSRAS